MNMGMKSLVALVGMFLAGLTLAWWVRGVSATGALPRSAPTTRWDDLPAKKVTVWIKGQHWGTANAQNKLESLPQVKGKVEETRDDWIILTVDGKETWIARESIWAIQPER